MKRVHIVGSGRSGTTLLHHMMRAGFAIDGFCSFEMRVLKEPEGAFGTYCSKRPRDLFYIGEVIDANPDLWVLCIERDPRDVVVSRHKDDAERYWIGIPSWRDSYRATRKLLGHPRFLRVRYEELVRDPDSVQAQIAAWIPWAPRKGRFSEFHGTVKAEERADAALGGVRPVSEKSIGAWRRHKPRLAGELKRSGPITEELIETGYEKDAQWLRELEGVEPDLRESVHEWPKRRTWWRQFIHNLRARYRNWKYWLRFRKARAEAVRAPRAAGNPPDRNASGLPSA